MTFENFQKDIGKKIVMKRLQKYNKLSQAVQKDIPFFLMLDHMCEIGGEQGHFSSPPVSHFLKKKLLQILCTSYIVNSRGLETPKGMGQGYAGVGVWVPIFQPLINPHP